MWERVYGVPGVYDDLQCVNTSYDQGYVILGGRYYYPNTRGWIIKTDINGNLLYEIILGTGTGMPQGSYPAHIESTSDGGMIICGSHENWTVNDVGVTKLDACGNLEWCKTFRTDNNYDWGRVIRELPNGGYIMLTHQYSDMIHKKIHLFRFDPNGELLWIQPYALTENNPYLFPYSMTDLIITAKGDYFMTGKGYWSSDSIVGRLKAITIIADSSRDEKQISIFQRDDDSQYSDAYNSVQNGSGSIFIGASDVDQNYHPMLLKMDTLGNFLTDTLVQFPLFSNRWADGYIIDPKFTNDGRMFAYTTYMDNTFSWEESLIGIHEIDSTGGWHNTFVHPGMHSFARMIITEDQKILIAGLYGHDYDQQIMLSKYNTSLEYDSIYTVPLVYDYLCTDTIVSKTIDLDCEVIVDVKDIPTREEYNKSIRQIYITPAPNPATEQVRFMLKNTEHHKNINIICYDTHGRQMSMVGVNSGITDKTMDISSWSPGIYMAIVYAGNQRVGSARFIKSSSR